MHSDAAHKQQDGSNQSCPGKVLPAQEPGGELERQRVLLNAAEEKIASLNKQLTEVSLQAGMSEVASSVLHNVGNVLNSVNVSTGVLMEKIRKSKGPALSRVAVLLDENRSELGPFFTQNEKGKQVVGYIQMLGTHLQREQDEMLRELETLTKWVEHIKEIVAMQQSYARRCGPPEPVPIRELIEDAIRINSGSFARHDTKVNCKLEDTLLVTVERHKVLQILVNVLRNAKYACDDSLRSDKEVTIRVRQDEPGKVKVVVSDNGIGIAPENMTRIFNHGFTTRKEGHGFGLHSGIKAAREMGGNLYAESEGIGKGATFTLELPVTRA